ncbi:hypothetical protein CK203_059626 [Vitis vinifera]|uniref:Integrase catalytic domain-containing protein n=1 Tax=Vitis vinifera TaxID=29760 RepID=A0A438FV00_VITVI|nr:hypothetical protein CK203_059626 [Vitis vinifera]
MSSSLVAIDYFTKWVEAASYARLTSSGVASFIRSHIICRYGVPHELISDRGVHFRAEVDTLVQRYSIRHHRSSAYRPQTNGAVEAANKNIKRILRKMAVLPVEIEMGSLRVALEQQIPETDWAQARFDQLNLLDERRLRAADHVRAYQRKMARAFKKRVKPRPLHVGVVPRGRRMVMDLDGNQFSEPTNVDQLKSLICFTCLLIDTMFTLGTVGSMAHEDFLYMLHFVHEGMGFDHWVFELSFPSFLSPYHPSLHYVPCLKTTLRPWDQISSSTASMWTARFILFDIVVIPGWGYVECLDSHVIISVRLAFRAAVHSRFTTFRVIMSHFFSSAFRATSQFDVQSHHHHFSASVFRAIITASHFGIQSHHRFSVRSEPLLSLTFRVITITSQLRCSEPSSPLLLVSAFRAIIEPSSPLFSVSAFRAIIGFQIDIQSPILELSSVFRSTFRVAFSVSAFRVVITSQLRCSEPSSLLLSVLAFRVIIGFQIDVQSRVLGFGVQSRYHFSASVFRAIITTSLSFGVQSHHRFSDRHSESHPRFRRSESLSLLSLTFRVIIITSQFRCSEPSLSLLSSTFRVIIITSQFRRSELSSVFRSTFRVTSSVSAFRVVITSQFDVQSHHHHFLVSTSRSIIIILLRLPEPLLSSCLGFQSHYHHLA